MATMHSPPLWTAAAYGRTEEVGSLLSYDANCIEERGGERECSPLHVAAINGNWAAARLILVYGADASAKDKHGEAPLHAAARSGHEELIRLLLNYGADPSKDCDGRTPLHWALLYRRDAVILLLLEHGAVSRKNSAVMAGGAAAQPDRMDVDRSDPIGANSSTSSQNGAVDRIPIMLERSK